MIKIPVTESFLLKLKRVVEMGLVAAVFCLIFVMAHRALFDLDIWLHLKTGEYIVQNKIVPSQDIFSFTFPGKPWTDHSWAFQVLTYLVYNTWQADGLIFLQSLLVIFSFFTLFLIGYKTLDSHLEVSALLVATALGSLVRFNIRPGIFSFLFFALYLYFLRLRVDKKTIWLLIPLQVLWVNFHGYFFLGPLLILFFIVADFLEHRLLFLPSTLRENASLSEEASRRLKILFLFACLACFINPRGWVGAAYPLFVMKDALLGKMQVFLKYIQELQPTLSSLKGQSGFYVLMSSFALFAMAINFRRVKIIDIILFVFFFFFSQTLRNIVFFLFVCHVVVISNAQLFLKMLAAKINKLRPAQRKLYWALRCVAPLFFIAWLGLRMDKLLGQSYYDFDSREIKSLVIGVDERYYPRKAVDFILESRIPGNMFNDFNSGAYLIGRTFPQRKVFIDGRTEFYGPEFFKECMDALKKDITAFETIVRNHNITSVFASMALDVAPNLVGYLYRSPQWHLAYLDERGVLFLKDVPENHSLIGKYKMDLSHYTVPRIDLKELRLKVVYPAPYVSRAFLFDLFGEDELVMSECREALRIMPNCGQAFYLLAKIHMRKAAYEEALVHLRSCLLFVSTHVKALVDLGICYQELGEAELAAKTFKRAIRVDPKSEFAYYRLGCLYLAQQETAKAMAAIKKAISLQPENPRNYFKLAEALHAREGEAKDFEQIRSHLIKARKLCQRFEEQGLGEEIEDFIKKLEDEKR